MPDVYIAFTADLLHRYDSTEGDHMTPTLHTKYLIDPAGVDVACDVPTESEGSGAE